MAFTIVGKKFTPDEFDAYIKALKKPGPLSFRPSGVTLHHTAAPSLEQAHGIITHERIINLLSYYRDERNWKAGPHLFVDTEGIWVFTPLSLRGIHARSFNRNRWGLEMLGDYDDETPDQDVLYNATRAMAALLRRINKAESAINFHRDDPKTDKSCPGTKISKSDIRGRVAALLAGHDNRLGNAVFVKLVYGSKVWSNVAYIVHGTSSAMASVKSLNGVAGVTTDAKDDTVVAIKPYFEGKGFLVSWDSEKNSVVLTRSIGARSK